MGMAACGSGWGYQWMLEARGLESLAGIID